MIWIAGLFGLVFGSFANVVAYRVPKGLSIASPPSACPVCATPIRPRDNIPVVGWLLLRGRCRACRAPISARYPLVELGTGVLFALFAYRMGLSWVLPAYLAFALVTMILLLTDIDVKRIPNSILLVGGGFALVLLVIGALVEAMSADLLRAGAGGLIYFAILFTLAIVSRGGMGMGDVKLALLLGVFTAFLSWAVFIAGIIAGFIMGGLIGLVLLLTGKKGRKDEVPFGPPLIVASWLVILCEQAIVTWLPYLPG